MTTSPLTPDAYRLSWSDWLEMPEHQGFCEIIGGELFMSPAPSITHPVAVRNIFRLLDRHVADHNLGETLFAPTGVRLSDEDVVEPDVLVILDAHRERLGELALMGAPDLVVEVLSPCTARRDLIAKRALYEAHSVQEYWIVDPIARRIEVLVLDGEVFVQAGLYAAGDSFESTLLSGLEIAVDAVLNT